MIKIITKQSHVYDKKHYQKKDMKKVKGKNEEKIIESVENKNLTVKKIGDEKCIEN